MALSHTHQKLETLKSILKEMQGAVIAFSGGVDSTLVLKMAREVLGDRCLAVIATSPLYPDRELKAAIDLAKRIGVRYQVLPTDEMDDPDFRSNPPNRCYHCKKELYSKIWKIAQEHGFSHVIDGSNVDDLGDYRPGLKALREMGVRSPLIEAQLTKAEIREISRRLGLPTWDKPAMACLASRFPYGTSITPEKLKQVDKAENFLRQLGFRTVRVRHHGEIARIEIGTSEIPRILEGNRREEVVAHLKALGYTYVTLDLQGYRTGSMNELKQLRRK